MRSPKLTPRQIQKLITRYIPKGTDVRWRHDGKLRPAWADINDGKLSMLSPYPDTPMRALTFLHECAHFANGHWRCDVPEHEMEFESELLAMFWWNNEGFVVPLRYLQIAKAYVKNCIKADRKRGVNIKPHIERWATS